MLLEKIRTINKRNAVKSTNRKMEFLMNNGFSVVYPNINSIPHKLRGNPNAKTVDYHFDGDPNPIVWDAHTLSIAIRDHNILKLQREKAYDTVNKNNLALVTEQIRVLIQLCDNLQTHKQIAEAKLDELKSMGYLKRWLARREIAKLEKEKLVLSVRVMENRRHTGRLDGVLFSMNRNIKSA